MLVQELVGGMRRDVRPALPLRGKTAQLLRGGNGDVFRLQERDAHAAVRELQVAHASLDAAHRTWLQAARGCGINAPHF